MNQKIQSVNHLLQIVKGISSSYEKVAKATGEKFNIFSVLKIETDEVATHSRLISELLNPKGTHGQGNRFLEKFIQLEKFANSEKLLDQFEIKDFNLDGASVKTEFHIGKKTDDCLSGGRIDIVIKNSAGEVIIIENKLYATDQPKQLTRYQESYLNGKLIYLTLWGTETKDVDDKLLAYEKISYSNDIITWLEECKKESVNMPLLRETIHQYINLIKKITHQNSNQNMNNEIVDAILQSSESLKIWRQMSDKSIQREVRRRLITSIVKMIEGHYKGKDGMEIVDILDVTKMDVENYRGILISIQNEELKKHKLSIRFNFEEKRCHKLIVGLFSSEGIKNSLSLDKISDVKSSRLYPAYITFDEYKDWWTGTLNEIRFNFGVFADIADEKVKILQGAMIKNASDS